MDDSFEFEFEFEFELGFGLVAKVSGGTSDWKKTGGFTEVEEVVEVFVVESVESVESFFDSDWN